MHGQLTVGPWQSRPSTKTRFLPARRIWASPMQRPMRAGAQVAAPDLDGGQETPGAHIHRKRDRHVEHGGGKTTLDIAEVIAEGGLQCEGDARKPLSSSASKSQTA